MKKAKVSILYATYCENLEYLKNSMDSIIHQSFPDWELIVCLEPGERNMSVFEEYAAHDERIILIRNHQRLGLAGSLKIAASRSSGEYLARMDSDDISDRDRLMMQVQYLDSNNTVDLLGTSMRLMDERGAVYGKRIYPAKHDDIVKRFRFSNAVAHPTVMMRRERFDKTGYYNSEFVFSEDLELWLRAIAMGLKVENLEEQLLNYRIPKANFTKRTKRHWYFNLRARKLHAKNIWNFWDAQASMILPLIMSTVPQTILSRLKYSFGFDHLRGVSHRD